jgi:hypothetical protein
MQKIAEAHFNLRQDDEDAFVNQAKHVYSIKKMKAAVHFIPEISMATIRDWKWKMFHQSATISSP